MEDKKINAMEQALNKANETSNKSMGPMPEPEIKNYEPTFKLTDRFVTDVHKYLEDYPYSQTQALMKAVDNSKDSVGVQLLNQIIQAIAQFPYKSVKPIMEVVESRDQSVYWTPLA